MMMSIKNVEKYKGNYKWYVVGDFLGNFHVDFSKDGAKSDCYAVESVFLGKQYIYIYIYIYWNQLMNMVIKSIANRLEWKAFHYLVLNITQTNNKSVLYVYKRLYDNDSITLDLTNEGNTFVCKHDKDHTVPNVS